MVEAPGRKKYFKVVNFPFAELSFYCLKNVTLNLFIEWQIFEINTLYRRTCVVYYMYLFILHYILVRIILKLVLCLYYNISYRKWKII